MNTIISLDQFALESVTGGAPTSTHPQQPSFDVRGALDTAGRVLNVAGHDAQNGAVLGTIGGAVYGSVVPGVGTVAGATGGAIGGTAVGAAFGLGRGVGIELNNGTFGKATPSGR